MSDLTAYEKETIINYNAAEKTASIYTHDRSLIRKLMAIADTRDDIIVKHHDDECASFIVPKKWIKVNAGRVLTEEERSARAERMRSMKSAKISN